MCLIKRNGKTGTEEFTYSKEVQEFNVREKLKDMGNDDIVVLTDRSALSNPGPTVNPISNYYTGIKIDLECLTDLAENSNL